MVMLPEELSFLYAMKRCGPKEELEGGCDWLILASFRRQIDNTAVASMSGRHQTNFIN